MIEVLRNRTFQGHVGVFSIQRLEMLGEIAIINTVSVGKGGHSKSDNLSLTWWKKKIDFCKSSSESMHMPQHAYVCIHTHRHAHTKLNK